MKFSIDYKVCLVAVPSLFLLRQIAASDIGIDHEHPINVASAAAEDVAAIPNPDTTSSFLQDMNSSTSLQDGTSSAASGGGLRGADSLEAMQSLEAKISNDMAQYKNPMEVANLPIEERATVMEKIKTSLTDATHFLKTIDWASLSPESSSENDNMGSALVKTMESTLEPIETAVELVREAATSGGPATNNFKRESNDEQSSTTQEQRRRRTKTADGKHKKKQGNHWNTKFKFSGNNNMFDQFNNFPKQYREALRAANHDQHKRHHKRKKGGPSLLGRHISRHAGGAGRRRLDETYENKYYMCEQLAECVKAMSIYDQFVFFKSDDIDQAAGTVDENMIVYDERDYLGKYETTQTQADEILQEMSRRRLAKKTSMDDALSGKCNNLLQEFHRTVESDEVPKWEGGTVSQVCYAEGSQVYVKLGDAAFASVDTTDFRTAAEEAVEKQFGTTGTTATLWSYEVPTNHNVMQIAATSDGKKFALHKNGRFLWHHYNANQGWRSTNGGVYNGLFTTPFQKIDAAKGNRIVAIDYNDEVFKFSSGYEAVRFDTVGTSIDTVSVGRDGFVMGIDRMDGVNELCLRRGGSWDCSRANSRVCNHDFTNVFVGSKDHIYLIKTNNEIYHFRGWKNGVVGQANCGSTGTFRKVKGKGKWMSVAVDDNGKEKSVYLIGTNKDVYVMRQAKDRYNSGDTWKKIAEGSYTTVSSNGKGNLFVTKENGSWCYWRTGSKYMNFDSWNGESTKFGSRDGWNEFVCSSENHWRLVKVSAVSNDVCLWRDNVSPHQIKCKTVGTGTWTEFYPGRHDGTSTTLQHFDMGASKHNMYTVSTGDTVKRRRGDNWAAISGSSVKAVRDVSVTDSGRIYMVDWGNEIWSRAYGSGSPIQSTQGEWSQIAAVDNKYLWGISTDGKFYHITRTGASSLESKQYSKPSNKKLIHVAAGPSRTGSPWVVDEENNVFRLNRITNTWVEESSDDAMFRQVSVGKTDFVLGLAVGNKTRAYRGTDIHFRGLAEAYEHAIETYAQETLQCATTLFYQNNVRRDTKVLGSQRFKSEKFVFGIGGANPKRPCDEDGCDMSKYRIPVEVCHPDDTDCQRDEFGQLESNRVPAYNFKNYTDLVEDFKTCAYSLVDEFDADLTEKLKGDEVRGKQDGLEILEETMDDFLGDLHQNCLRAEIGDHLDVGLELVFGERASPGFICGMAEHVAEKKKTMPGYCCLDAPFELSGDAWGLPYDCASKTCSTMGPFFSGMSTESCDAQGGTWCPYETDCKPLKRCIKRDIEESESEFPAYSNYLKSAPAISDPTDQAQCGRAREFFGFDEYFLNDRAICDEIYELRFSKDFNWMNEFFGGKPAGKGRAAGDNAGSYIKLPTIDGLDFDPIKPPTTPEFDLGDIEYARSGEELAEKGLVWRHTNTALDSAYSFVQVYLEDERQDNKCELLIPDGGCITPAGPSPTSFAKFACELKRQLFMTILGWARFAIATIRFASQVTYTFTMEQGNNEPWQMMDEIAAVKTNMDFTGVYLQKRFEQQNEFIADHHQKVGEALKEHQRDTGEHVTNTNQLVINAVNHATDTVTSMVKGGMDTALALKSEIVSNDDTLKQVVLMTTFQGSLIDYSSVVIQAISGGTSAGSPGGSLSDISPTNTQNLGSGKVLLTLPSTSKVVTFDITLDVGGTVYKQSALISFGVCPSAAATI